MVRVLLWGKVFHTFLYVILSKAFFSSSGINVCVKLNNFSFANIYYYVFYMYDVFSNVYKMFICKNVCIYWRTIQLILDSHSFISINKNTFIILVLFFAHEELPHVVLKKSHSLLNKTIYLFRNHSFIFVMKLELIIE